MYSDAQLCLTLCNPINCSPPCSFIHEILQARILEWVAMPTTGDLPNPGIKPMPFRFHALAGGFFTTSATWEALVLWLRSVNMLVSEIFDLIWSGLIEEKKPVNPKENQSWIFIGRIDVEAETPILGHLMQRINETHLKRPWCWERLKAGGEGDDRGWDGWMASLTLWTRVWASSGSWWWTGEPGVLQSMGLQRFGIFIQKKKKKSIYKTVRLLWVWFFNWLIFNWDNLPKNSSF